MEAKQHAFRRRNRFSLKWNNSPNDYQQEEIMLLIQGRVRSIQDRERGYMQNETNGEEEQISSVCTGCIVHT